MSKKYLHQKVCKCTHFPKWRWLEYLPVSGEWDHSSVETDSPAGVAWRVASRLAPGPAQDHAQTSHSPHPARCAEECCRNQHCLLAIIMCNTERTLKWARTLLVCPTLETGPQFLFSHNMWLRAQVERMASTSEATQKKSSTYQYIHYR